MPDQTARRITKELIHIFSTYGAPWVMHSNQGRNFESTILAQTLEAFRVTKSRTTAYHPQADGIVYNFNRSLLQLLRSYVNSQSGWEYYLPLVLYAYHTATHISTGVSPFLLMFGRSPSLPRLNIQNAFTATSYPDYLTAKLAELRDLVDVTLTEAALSHKRAYDQHSANLPRLFTVNDPVWLVISTAGKLDPRWEAEWIVKSVKSPENIEITNSKNTKVVHINKIQP